MKTVISMLLCLALFSPAATLSGGIKVCVLDFNTSLPIENATVCVVEQEKYYKTNADGKTKQIDVEIKPNKKYAASKSGVSEVTLLVYKEGYADCLLFSVKARGGISRLGPTILLCPAEKDAPPQIFVEEQDEDYIASLIKKHKR